MWYKKHCNSFKLPIIFYQALKKIQKDPFCNPYMVKKKCCLLKILFVSFVIICYEGGMYSSIK